MIVRNFDIQKIQKLQSVFPVTAILGPRQCGKTTLAKQVQSDHYFDLENPSDVQAMETPQLALQDLKGVIVIDEIQRKPDLFPLLRFLVDEDPEKKFLILGSASRELISKSGESLAGRIGYHYLSGFRLGDVGSDNLQNLWLQGGFPRAYTAESQETAQLWLSNYITTVLERDIPQLGYRIPSVTMRRFWSLMSHQHGQLLNYAKLAGSFGVSDHTVRRYMDIFTGMFLLRTLHPWHPNTGKRFVKRPKVYIRDSGLLHNLLSISSFQGLLSSDLAGESWEGFALEQVAQVLGKRDEELYFWKIHSGSEVDLFWQNGGNNWAVEFKLSDAPALTKSMNIAIDELNLAHLWVVYPGEKTYRLSERVTVIPQGSLQGTWPYESPGN